ncbi:MAG: methyl-accepting chemotaxis protein [Acidiferrobacterales bacterium]
MRNAPDEEISKPRSFLRLKLRGKLLLITGVGTALLLSAALYGLWTTWSGTQVLGGQLRAHTAASLELAHMRSGILTSLKLMGLAIIIAFAWFLAVLHRAILVPARAVTEHLERLAQGNFSESVLVRGGDEFGQIAVSAAHIQAELGALIAGIREAARQVSDGISSMRQSAERTDSALSRQDSETEQVAAAMHEMATTSQEVARNTAETAHATQDARSRSQEGALASANAIGGIESLTARVHEASEAVGRMKGRAQNIGEILAVIAQVSEQTKLLALNAAIEAARAGEQGRGFAVVADEVRSLAQRTQTSTEQIQEIIERLQDGVQETVKAMERVSADAVTSEVQVEAAASSLAEIVGAVKRIDEMSLQIATAAEEQTAVANEVSRNLTAIAEGSRQADGYARTAADQSRHLESLMSHVATLVQRFRLPENR